MFHIYRLTQGRLGNIYFLYCSLLGHKIRATYELPGSSRLPIINFPNVNLYTIQSMSFIHHNPLPPNFWTPITGLLVHHHQNPLYIPLLLQTCPPFSFFMKGSSLWRTPLFLKFFHSRCFLS